MEKSLNLSLVVDKSVADFLSAAGFLLYQSEATNSLILGLLENLKTQTPSPAPLLVRITSDGTTVSAAVSFRKQPLNVILTFANEAQLQTLAEYLQKTGEVFSGVVGPKSEVEIFTRIWKTLTGRNRKLIMAQKIYKIERVDIPANIDGAMTIASQDDLDFLHLWMKAFVQESLPNEKRTEQQWREAAETAVRKQTAHIWVSHGTPVSMAFITRSTQNGASISLVYTPPAHRKKGYASAVVAHLSQKMLENGKQFCVLYTDLANPTSNKIYQNIGYREVTESMHFDFIDSSVPIDSSTS